MISAKNIADNFNDYFVSPSTTLANQTTVPNDRKDMFGCFINGNITSVFLCGANEFDIIETVRKQTNKQTTDVYSIDMKIIEKKLYR